MHGGAFNSNINRSTERYVREHASEHESIGLAIVGRKGRDYFKRRDVTISRIHTDVLTDVRMERAREIGEGVIVAEYASRLAIEGVDPNYSSERVRTASLAALPYGDGTFDRALCLDVLEHLTFDEQAVAIRELHRVLRSGGRTPIQD